MEREADVVIVGLGAAGGIAAHVLTRAGLDVVALEAGPRLYASQMTMDEVRNDGRGWMSEPKSRGEVPTWRLDGSRVTEMLMVNAVGGTSIHYHAWSLRFPPWQFEARSRALDRYGPAAIGDDSTLADWPISYADLEPFYDRTEYAIGVSGRAGNLRGALQAGGNPFEGPRSRSFPMPPVRPAGWSSMMADAARSLGWHPFPAPAAINSEPYDGRPACAYCGFCTGNGCYLGAKGSTNVTVIPHAEATGRLRIEASARVTRINVDADGLATGVTYVQDGREHVQNARVVLLAALVYENTRLLLLSRSPRFPDGLSNNHGQVGQHYMAHISVRRYGTFSGRRLNLLHGASGAQGTCVDDWNDDNFDHAGLGFIGGGMFTAIQEERPIGMMSQLPPPGVPRWGSAWKAWALPHAQSTAHVGAELWNLPYASNFMDLDPVVKDPYGLPVVRVTHRIGDNERRAVPFLSDKLRVWLEAAGATQTWPLDHIRLESRHPFGGTRMGLDPATSVVDRYGFSHEVPNLGVLGASNFPTTGGHNPTLTLQALSWLTAQHLVDHFATRSRGTAAVRLARL
jgi:gluconate 2-dehydrogenase alpha chain